MKVTKLTLVDDISLDNPDIPKYKISRIVELTFNEIMVHLQNNERVTIYNFGTFEIQTKKETRVRHPITKKVIKVPARKYIKFIPSINLSFGD